VTVFVTMAPLERDPNLENIRSDSDFVALMKQLQSQWERYAATL